MRSSEFAHSEELHDRFGDAPLGSNLEQVDARLAQLADERLGMAEDGEEVRAPLLDADTLDLIAAFQRIEDTSLRKSLLNTVRAAARAFDPRQDED